MIELPMEVSGKVLQSPKELVIIGQPKVGKTSAILGLENCLLINLEKKYPPFPGKIINVFEEILDNSNFTESQLNLDENSKRLIILFKIASMLKEAYKKGQRYDYIVIDNLSELEDIANPLAKKLYMSTTVGANFEGNDVVAELKMGSGYQWLRKAFVKIFSSFRGLATKCTIFIVHPKLVSMDKNGVEINILDIDLTGKLKGEVIRSVDSTGVMYRDTKDKNKVILSFTSENGIVSKGSNIQRIANKEFVITEMTDDGELKYYWDQIFVD